jgi:hypothetical protein
MPLHTVPLVGVSKPNAKIRLKIQFHRRRHKAKWMPTPIPVAAHVRELMADRAQWTGSASDLLQAGTNRSGWPKSARALAGRLRRAQTFLRTLGGEIVFGREGRLGTRTITITAGGESRSHTTVSIISRVSNDGRAAAQTPPSPGLEQAL